MVTTPTYTASQQGTCPREWFSAEIVTITDQVLTPAVFVPTPDTNLKYFRNVLGFTDAQIETATQNAIDFFQERFGLNFSQSVVNELGVRTFQNTTMNPFMVDNRIMNIITINGWIFTGKNTSVCFRVLDGGYALNHQGTQLLHGTYGGEQGIYAPTDVASFAFFGYYHIPIDLHRNRLYSQIQYNPYSGRTYAQLLQSNSVQIQFKSRIPIRTEPIDGTGIIYEDLFHQELGNGVAQGSYRVTAAGNGSLKYSVRSVFTFPAHLN